MRNMQQYTKNFTLPAGLEPPVAMPDENVIETETFELNGYLHRLDTVIADDNTQQIQVVLMDENNCQIAASTASAGAQRTDNAFATGVAGFHHYRLYNVDSSPLAQDIDLKVMVTIEE